MTDLKEAAIELGHEKLLLEASIQKLIDEFQSKTGFGIQEVITTEILSYGDKKVRRYSVKCTLA